MQRAPDRLIDDKTIGEIAAIVGAEGPDREESISCSHQHHVGVAGVSKHSLALLDGPGRNAIAQVGSLGLLRVGHKGLRIFQGVIRPSNTCNYRASRRHPASCAAERWLRSLVTNPSAGVRIDA